MSSFSPGETPASRPGRDSGAGRDRIRRDVHHKAALCLARRFGGVVVEDLNVKVMTASAKGTVAEPGRKVRQKAGLNRSILNPGWSEFACILAY